MDTSVKWTNWICKNCKSVNAGGNQENIPSVPSTSNSLTDDKSLKNKGCDDCNENVGFGKLSWKKIKMIQYVNYNEEELSVIPEGEEKLLEPLIESSNFVNAKDRLDETLLSKQNCQEVYICFCFYLH